MEECVDGEYQAFKASGGAFTREHFFGKYPELKDLIADLSDYDIWRLDRGGHDAQKAPPPMAEAIAVEVTEIADDTPKPSEPILVPDQSPAPVRVEERDGKIARVHDRDSPLRAAERDFNAWRELVIDHIEELTSGDFHEGTNHSRARDRLVALGNLLPGDIAEVKDQQFRIGYEIERFEGLIAAYRSGGDDMPELNAAALEDLDRLRIALKMGVDKLERWAEFRRLATDDPRREGDTNPEAVGDVLDQMAEKMERQTKYFDPELPASFRFLAEAVKDRVGATKTVVYGAVKSAENLIIPRSRHDPKILWVDDAEIVGDRITKVRPIPRNLFTQKTERRIGELGTSCVALVVSDVSVHEAP